jgi:hypothetical protein
VADRVRQGLDITAATMPASDTEFVAESNMLADRDEDFNTRYGSFRGWQMAIEKVKPIPRDTAQLDLSRMVREADLHDTSELVDYFIYRFMRVAPSDDVRHMLVAFLNDELGSADIAVADSYMEDALRLVLHLIMSQPEYQLG